jgi:hypothetical protein
LIVVVLVLGWVGAAWPQPLVTGGETGTPCPTRPLTATGPDPLANTTGWFCPGAVREIGAGVVLLEAMTTGEFDAGGSPAAGAEVVVTVVPVLEPEEDAAAEPVVDDTVVVCTGDVLFEAEGVTGRPTAAVCPSPESKKWRPCRKCPDIAPWLSPIIPARPPRRNPPGPAKYCSPPTCAWASLSKPAPLSEPYADKSCRPSSASQLGLDRIDLR